MKISPICVSSLNFKSETKSNDSKKENLAKKSHHYISATGWATVASFGISAVTGSMKKFKLHKVAAAAGFIFGAAHIAEIYIHRFEMKKNLNLKNQK